MTKAVTDPDPLIVNLSTRRFVRLPIILLLIRNDLNQESNNPHNHTSDILLPNQQSDISTSLKEWTNGSRSEFNVPAAECGGGDSW